MKYENQLKELRNKIPVGIKKAMIVLEKNNGNVELSVELIKKEFVNILIAKTGIDSNKAINILYRNNFNIQDAVKTINESKFSITENILKRITSNEQKSIHLYRAIINENFEYDNVPTFDKVTLKKLNIHQGNFIILIEWLEYLDYEGFWSAIHSKFFEESISIIDLNLNMKNLSSELTKAKEIEAQIRMKFNSEESNVDSHIMLMNQLDNNEIYSRAEKLLWKEKEEGIYKTLMLYVEKNLISFP